MAFNNLKDDEAEALAILAEEASEVVQEVCKIKRHGLESFHPKDFSKDNRGRLEQEIGDFLAAVSICSALGIIDMDKVDLAAVSKLDRIGQYLHHIDLQELDKEASERDVSNSKTDSESGQSSRGDVPDSV